MAAASAMQQQGRERWLVGSCFHVSRVVHDGTRTGGGVNSDAAAP